jgi:hypothetical protein
VDLDAYSWVKGRKAAAAERPTMRGTSSWPLRRYLMAIAIAIICANQETITIVGIDRDDEILRDSGKIQRSVVSSDD